MSTRDKIISLDQHRAIRETDPHLLVRDDIGRPMWWFSITYQMGGTEWSTRVLAYSWDDAQARLNAIRVNGVVDGQIMGEVPL